MKKAFTLVEILIVVAILGILAAIVLPTVQGHVQQAKESAAKDNLRILRNTIALYAARHNDVPPGYLNNDPTEDPLLMLAAGQLVSEQYLPTIPENPFNNLTTLLLINNTEALPENATGDYGWIYKPATKTIRLDWPGNDSTGALYYQY
jgi:prepilin-type N-terminal cleavage/methylation domain-containing protein